MRQASKLTQRSRVLALTAAALILFSSTAPVASAGLALPNAAPHAAPTMPLPAYAHQLAFLQNPVQDPGFELEAPAWVTAAGATVRDGAAYMPAGGSLHQDFPVASDEGSGAFGAAAAFVNGEAIAFRASGNASVTLEYVELPTGETFVALSASFASDGRVVRLSIPQSPRLAQSSPLRIAFVGEGAGAVIDDVVLEGVEYGDPRLPAELDEMPRDARLAIATLEDAAASQGVPLPLTALVEQNVHAHDGYGLLILPLDFTPARGGIQGAVASPATFAGQPGAWRFVVYLAEYGPSGPTLLSADARTDARLFLNTTPTLFVDSIPAEVSGLLALSDTPYADLLRFDEKDARGVVFRTGEVQLGSLNLVAAWRAPSDAGGLYGERDARGFFHPAKLALADLPIADALDAVAAPISAFGVGVVPCPGADGLTYRFGDLDCDREADASEIQCGVEAGNGGVNVRPFQPDPLDPTTNCLDPDGDGLVEDYDPLPYVPGNLTVTLGAESNGVWWSGVRSLPYVIDNTYNGDNQERQLTIRTYVVFQTADDTGLEGQRAACEGADTVTSSAQVSGTCRFDTRDVPEGADYGVLLVAEVLQGPHQPPAFADPLARNVGVDNSAPLATELVPVGERGANGWYLSSVEITFTASDALSGIDRVECATDEDALAPCERAIVSAPGRTDLRFRAVDKAGNRENTTVESFFLSLADPVVSCASTTPPAGDEGWHLAPWELECVARSDTPTSVITVSLDGGAPSSGTAPVRVPITTAGEHVLVARATDEAGRSGAVASFSAPLDLAGPRTTLDIVGRHVAGNLYGSSLDVGFTVEDDASGLRHTLVSLNGAAARAFLPGERLLLPDDGTHRLVYQSIDIAGRAEAARNRTLVIDTTAPRTINTVTGALGSNGWYRSNITVELNATDDGSGIASTLYSLDGSADAAYPTEGIRVEGDDRHVLQYHSVDHATNAETAPSVALDIDSTSPTVAFEFDGPSGAGSWFVGPVTATVVAGDATSGLDATYYLAGNSGYVRYTGPFTVEAQGLNSVAAYAVDVAGNAAPVQSAQVKIDSTPPVTTITLRGQEASNGWFAGPVEVELRATDAVSGVARVEFSLDGGAFVDYTGPFNVTGDAAHELRARARDVAGNVEVARVALVRIDTVAPLNTTLMINGTLGNADWYRSPVTLTFTASDATSGIRIVRVSTDGGQTYAEFAGAGPHAVELNTSGTYALAWQAHDVSGLAEASRSGSVKLDLLAPTSFANLTGASTVAGWINAPPATLTLEASDPFGGSGVASIEYRVDGGNWTTYAGPIDFAVDGEYAVDHRARDLAGNVEAERTVAVSLDATAPHATAEISGPQVQAPWYTGDVSVFLNATDATSGAKELRRVVAGTPATGPPLTRLVLGAQGTNEVTYTPVDHAGNEGPTRNVTFQVDALTPTTQASLDGTLGANGHYTSGVRVTLSNVSGPSGATTEYRIGDTAAATYSGPFDITGQGETNVSFRSVSGAGLVEAWTTRTLRLDLEDPTTSHSLAGENVSTAYYRTNVTVTLVDDDTFSGVARTEYRLGSGTFQDYTGPFEVSALGATPLVYRSIDQAGRVEQDRSTQILVDWSAPVTSATFDGLRGSAGWFLGPVNVTLSAQTGPSGLASTRYALGDAALQPYAPFQLAADGNHTVRFTSRSGADVNETVKSALVQVDSVAPVSTLDATGDQVNPGYYVSLVTITLAATDATSGVASIEYRVNGGDWTTYAGPVTPALTGNVTFERRAIDVAGNVENVQTFTYLVDPDVPVSTLTLAGTLGQDGWYVSDVTATLTATAGPSGLDRIEWRSNGAAFANSTGPIDLTSDGTYLFEHRAHSNAGLVEPLRNRTLKIDTIAPATNVTLHGTLGSNGYYTTPVQVELTVLDVTSGTDLTRYRLDGGDWATYADRILVGTSGSHTIAVESRDRAGNVEVAHSTTFHVDVDEIVTTILTNGTQGDGGWYTSPVMVTLEASGGPSNITLTEARIGAGAFFDYNATPFNLTSDGIHTIGARSTNGAGVVEPTRTLTVNIDQLPPEATHVLDPIDGLDGWHTGPNVGFVLSATDATSGVRAIQFRQNGGAWTTVTGASVSQSVTAAGYHTIEYRAIDNAGLVEAIRSFSFKLDGVAPTTSATTNGTLGLDGWYTSNATLTLSAQGGPSNVSSIVHALNGGSASNYSTPLSFADGIHNVTYNSTSGAGLTGATGLTTLYVDTVAPATTIALGGATRSGWHVENVTIFLNASDATSGVATTECSIDGATFAPCATRILVTKQGPTTVAVRTRDVAGNLETEHERTFRIDTLGPALEAVTNGTQVVAPWFTSSVRVDLTWTDPQPGSGNATIYRDGVPTPSSFTIDEDGTTRHVLQAIDEAGNAGEEQELTVRVDRIVPSTVHRVDAVAGSAGWLRSNATVTLNATTGPSGVLHTRYSIDGASAQTYDEPFTLAGEGNHTVTYATTSVARLVEPTQSFTLRIDTLPPTAELSVTGTRGANGWLISGASLEILASDATSGVASCDYAVGDGAFTSGMRFDLSADGVHEISFRCTDVAGNQGPTIREEVRIDTVDPTVTASVTAGSLGDAGHYVSPVTLSFTTTEATSGIARIMASRNGGAYTAVENATLLVSEQGRSEISYYAVDHAGRQSATGVHRVTVDSILPSVDVVLSGTLGDDGWYRSEVAADVVASDAGSGVVARTYSLDGSAHFSCGCPVSVSSNGAHVLNVTARDLAGNVGTKNDVAVKIDRTAPTTVATMSGTQGQGSWFVSAVTLSFTASDDLSGVRQILASVDNGDYEPVTSGSLTVATDGAHIVRYRAQDRAGNLEPVQERSFSIDTTPPVATHSLQGTPGEEGWYGSVVTVTLSGSDAGSGLAQLRYRLDGGSEVAYAGPFQVAAEGLTDLTYRAVDNASLSSEPSTAEIRIDTRAPSVAASATGTIGANGWYTTPASVTLVATDPEPGSGARAPTYSLDGGAARPYEGPVSVSGDGPHTITYAARDAAGNAGAQRTLRLSIDSTKPTAQILLQSLGTSPYTEPVGVEILAADATSGVAKREYSLDGATWTLYDGPFTIARSGQYTILARATDKAGLVSAAATASFVVDVDVPTLDVGPYRANVPTATPTVSARFGPVFTGWNTARVSLLVDGAAAPGCTSATEAGALVVSCTPVTWSSAFAMGQHSVVACATTLAGKEWCTNDLLTRADRLPWTFTVTADDWDRDTYPNQRESRFGSLAFNPYSVPYDPQGWNLRATPNDPTSPLLASDERNLSVAQSWVKLRFTQYEYASDPLASFAPNRTAVVASLDRIAIMEPSASTPPAIGIRAGVSEAASVTLGENETTIRIGGQAPIVVPARAVVRHGGDHDGTLGLELRALGQRYATIDLDETDLRVTLYGPDGAPLASYPPVDSDSDSFQDGMERVFGSDPGDANDTPVPRTESVDGYAVMMRPGGPLVPLGGAPDAGPQAVLLASSTGAFPVELHVDDLDAGARATLQGKRIRFAALRADAAKAYLPGEGGPAGLYDTGALSPAGRDPTASADWSLDCIVGQACPSLRLPAGGDGTRVIIDIPSTRVAVGPYLLWAYVDLEDRGGIDSARGFYAAPKAILHDGPAPEQALLLAQAQDHTATPVLFVALPNGQLHGSDPDGDGYSTAQELGIDSSSGSGSDPFDAGSTPGGDDDDDGCKNRDETIPSWLIATRGCEPRPSALTDGGE